MDRSPVRGVARLAAILDSLPEALLLIDGGGRVVNANAVAVGWFEAPGAPLVGRPVTDLLSGFGTALARVASADSTAGVWTEPGDSGAGNASGAGGDDVGVPTRMVAKLADGTAFPAEVVRSFLPAAHGGLEVVVVRDVSRVADAEAELRRQQRQTELILRAASEGIVGVDTAGRVVLVNPAAARILKYRASELGGLEFDALLGGVASGEPSPVADTLRTGRKHRLGSEAGLQLTAKGGAAVPVELSTAPVLEGDTLVGAVVTFVDLARFRFPVLTPPAAAPGAANGAEGGISPESVGALRRPLEAARNELARLAASGDALTPSARHQLAHVTAELAEAARLVDDLLDVAAGPAGLRKRPAELGRIVHAATDAATDLAGAAGIDLAVHTGPAEVVIDAERMTQAVRHLLVDTVQASPRGSTVVVAAARRGPIARIEVRGAEIGGVPEHLGFARTVVERHGGQLTVHRVEGKGVTYVIELPVGPEGENELASGAPAASRNLVEETRIIPVVRELDPPEAASAHGGRRRLEAAASAASPAAASGSASGSQASVVSLSGAANASNLANASSVSGASAVATTTTIPRQAGPSADNGWFDGVRGYAAPPPSTPAAPAADPAPPAEPRGRRRAAQPGDNYLIQHVEPAPSFELDSPLRTSGSYQEEAALATSGNFTPEAQQASSLYGDLFREPAPSPAPFGTDDGMPLFRDEVPTTGTHATGARHGHGAGEAQSSGISGDPYGGAYGTDPQQPAPFASGFGGEAQPAFPTEPQNASPFGAQAPPFLSEQQTSSPFGVEQSSSPFGMDQQQQSPYGIDQQQQSPYGIDQQQPSPPFLAEAPSPFAEPQRPVPFLAEPQAPAPSPFEALTPAPPVAQPSAREPHAWPNPAEPDPQPAMPSAMAAWPPPDAPEPATPPTLLVWPTPEPSAEQLLVSQGYAPTALKAPAQLQETGPSRPVALLADPVGVPVTRAALHTLRAAAADSGIPLFVTAGLGAVPAASVAATARRGADPSALLRALTPEQVASPRVLLLEENPDLAAAFAISLERDGMRVVQAATENDAMSALSAEHPQLVVMNLTLVRRRRSGVIEWLRAYERLHLAPTVLYTVPAGMAADTDLVHALRSGAAAVHLTDREVGQESANRLLDLMGKVSD
ncbi:response regulator [Catenulispora subtropica]|uniref:PAS/PAC sensor protein n=1 Tax=Catenulispora subtropica TaxID=450798 RepID=A0ABN2RHV3_9ACTN